MADIEQYLWGVAPEYMNVSGTVTVEDDWVRVVAEFSWTTSLLARWSAAGDPIWLLLPRNEFDAADNEVGGGEIPGYGEVNWSYLAEWGLEGSGETYDPTIGYIGYIELDGDLRSASMRLIRGDCFLMMDVRDEFEDGIDHTGSMDIRWLNGDGVLGAQFGGPGWLRAG